jgi:hypothetical protein
MPSPYLTKTDFKACYDCRTKLFYRKHTYPTNLDDNDYLRFLADGGFMIEFLAKAKFPGGVDLAGERDAAKAVERTNALLSAGATGIFEAAVTVEKLHARIDILRQEAGELHLIEVKSASLGLELDEGGSPFLNRKGTVAAKWQKYLIDVAFQTHVLRLAHPGRRVVPFLCLIDKRAPVTPAETLDRFALRKDRANPKARPEVAYRGDMAALRFSQVVRLVPVEAETAMLMPEVLAKAAALAELLEPGGVRRVQEEIGDLYKQCRTCEYRVEAAEKNGFRECWGRLAGATPHILDLYRVGQIGSGSTLDPVPALLRRGKASLLDLEPGDLGKEGTLQERRLMQWTGSRDGGSEHLPAALAAELRSHEASPGWPLHFMDFEACDIALPHHAGLRPYERVAFQWSCHTIGAAGELSHAEWLNTGRALPNFAFARTLRERLGDVGTVYVWSPYEQATLNRVMQQIAEWVRRDADEAVRVSGFGDVAELMALADWIDRLLGPADAAGKRHSPRIRDLHDLARRHYFHPRMGGRTSIKVVLPAVWEANARLREHPWFREYHTTGPDGRPLDPYKTLPALPFGDDGEEEDVVREGTGAIRVYQDLIFSEGATPAETEARSRLLRQYCQLDTAAMVMIWTHWTGA